MSEPKLSERVATLEEEHRVSISRALRAFDEVNALRVEVERLKKLWNHEADGLKAALSTVERLKAENAGLLMWRDEAIRLKADRTARDMRVAERVREACHDYVRSGCGKEHANAIDNLDLASLIGGLE